MWQIIATALLLVSIDLPHASCRAPLQAEIGIIQGHGVAAGRALLQANDLMGQLNTSIATGNTTQATAVARGLADTAGAQRANDAITAAMYQAALNATDGAIRQVRTSRDTNKEAEAWSNTIGMSCASAYVTLFALAQNNMTMNGTADTMMNATSGGQNANRVAQAMESGTAQAVANAFAAAGNTQAAIAPTPAAIAPTPAAVAPTPAATQAATPAATQAATPAATQAATKAAAPAPAPAGIQVQQTVAAFQSQTAAAIAQGAQRNMPSGSNPAAGSPSSDTIALAIAIASAIAAAINPGAVTLMQSAQS